MGGGGRGADSGCDRVSEAQPGPRRQRCATWCGWRSGWRSRPDRWNWGRVSADGWVGELLDAWKAERWQNCPQPPGVHGTLRPYQLRGFSWLDFLKQLGLGACLADDMGLGQDDPDAGVDSAGREARASSARCCWSVPTSVVGNWQKEAARFTPELPGAGASRRRPQPRSSLPRRPPRNTPLCSPATPCCTAIRRCSSGVDWAGVILDEAQNIKNPETKQARAARSLPSGYRIALTGTPVENNVGDLWSMMEFLNPGFLGSNSGFRKRFFVPIQVYSDSSASERLRRITAPFILRRLKTDKSIIADLPDKMEMKVFCNLTKEQASLYEAVVKDAQAANRECGGHQAQRPRAGDIDEVEAGVQSSGAVPEGQLGDRRAQRQTGADDGDAGGDAGGGRPLADLHAILGDGRICFSGTSRRPSAWRSCSCTGVRRRKQRDRMVERFCRARRSARVSACR